MTDFWRSSEVKARYATALNPHITGDALMTFVVLGPKGLTLVILERGNLISNFTWKSIWKKC